MKISILIPSRARIKILKKLLDDFYNNTIDFYSVEFLIKIDDDDDIDEYKNMIANCNISNINLIIGKQSYHLCEDYYNYMAKIARGDLIWALNDDCSFSYKGWDNIIRQLYETYHCLGKIFYINIASFHHSCNSFSGFPMLTKETIKALRFFHNPVTFSWGADKNLFNTFEALKNMFGINRIIFLPELSIFHYGNSSKTMLNDSVRAHLKVGHEMKGNFDAGAFITHGFHIKDAKILKEAIDKGQ